MPFSRAYATSMWSTPVERAAMHLSFGNASIFSLVKEEATNIETISASACAASASEDTWVSKYTISCPPSCLSKISLTAESASKTNIFIPPIVPHQKYSVSGTNITHRTAPPSRRRPGPQDHSKQVEVYPIHEIFRGMNQSDDV